jgi:hypothetical protein
MIAPATLDPPTMRAPDTIVFRGKPLPRAKGFVEQPKRLTCPMGHPVKQLAILREDGAIWCTYRAAEHQGECGALLYVLVFPALGHGRKRVWAADVTKAELDQMEALRLDADGALAYFGVSFTR